MCQTVEQNTAQGHGWILEQINFKALKSHQHLAKFSFRFNKEQSSDFRTNNSQFIQTRTVEPVEPPKPLTFVLWRQWQTSHSCHCSPLTSFVIPYKWLLFFIFFKSTRYQVQNIIKTRWENNVQTDVDLVFFYINFNHLPILVRMWDFVQEEPTGDICTALWGGGRFDNARRLLDKLAQRGKSIKGGRFARLHNLSPGC